MLFRSRLRHAVEDSGAAVVVAPGSLLGRLESFQHGIDPIRDAAAIEASQYLQPGKTSPESLAYVIYTSGSTGVPKGVEITHANLCHLIRWHLDAFGLTRQDRVSHLAGLGFDASVWEIWPALFAGATLCIVDDAVRSSPQLIQGWMLRERVTIGFVPTVHAAALMAMSWPANTDLRILLTGGDTLHACPPAALPFQVVNNYGPTECTVVATSAVLEPGSHGEPSIGRPIAGATVYLLDEQGAPVADGQIGQIYIGGTGVGRGYRNLIESTKLAFLPDSFANVAGARMYRSGDRGVRNADGNIDFRGRVDRQVKIRGHRIELDEIDAVLSRHPAIDFAVTDIHTSGSGESQLVAYVLPVANSNEAEHVPTTQKLQEHLSRSLPRYMIPAMFVRLSSLPLSPSGKIDLASLPDPAGAVKLEREVVRPAMTPLEERLLGLVRELLEIDSIAAEDNFFMAGGHSLLGMQLIVRLRSEFGVDLTLRQLFETPTAAQLAALVDLKLAQARLTAIWVELFHVPHVGLDVDFHELGGEEILTANLQRRILAEFGRHFTRLELIQNATVRKQSELLNGSARDKQSLPPGVVAMQRNGSRPSIFWLHYACPSLAKAMGEDQPFFYVSLTDEDLQSLGEAPTLEQIATCLIPKILATQPKGPYILGGYCLGGVLSYEVGYQLRGTGHDVAHVLMLDTPSPKYCRPAPVQTLMVHPIYLARKIAQLGIRTSFVKLLERLSTKFRDRADKGITPLQWEAIQTMAEDANERYVPPSYDGKVTLIIASDRPNGYPPEGSFLPFWQLLAPSDFNADFVDGHHLGLIEVPAVYDVAKTIASHLASPEEHIRGLHDAGSCQAVSVN